MQKDARVLYVITGPTVAGKTAFALRWARENDAEIVSCDALLFYRGMDIGTAKPTLQERSVVPHHCIDCVPVSQPYSVAEYIHAAHKAVQAIEEKGKKVLVTGGSGFYLRSFFCPVVDPNCVLIETAKAEAAQLEKEGLEAMLTRLKYLNAEGLEGLDVHNPRRVKNALERCLSTGKTIQALRQQLESAPFPFKNYCKKTFFLERSEASLKERIAQRTRQMLQHGLLEEVKSLLEEGLLKNPSAASAIGYREVITYLTEGVPSSIQELENLINTHTWQLVHKQMNWFRHKIPINEKVYMDKMPA